MLATDLSKHEFSPEFDDYLAGFSMTAKTLLYRLPSLISADLAVIVVHQSFSSSFDCIKSWQGNDFGHWLKTLLVYACYTRLRCYLFSDSSEDQFELGSNETAQSSDTLSYVGKAQQQLVFEKRDVWNMSGTEFFTLCERLLVLQSCAKPLTKCIDTADMQERIAKISPHRGGLETVLSNFYSLRWLGTLKAVEGIPNDQQSLLSDPKVIYATARAHLQRKEYSKAIPLFEQMKKENEEKLPIVDVYRGLAHSYQGIGSLEQAEEIYLEASKLSIGSSKEQILLKFEHALLNLKLNKDKADSIKDELFTALDSLRLDTATPRECLKDTLLGMTLQFGETHFQELLPLLCNPTRALAHCVHVMGEILLASKHEALGKLYLTKARSLGLQMVLDNDVDSLAKVAILNNEGKYHRCLEYLDRARELIQRLSIKDELVKQIECDIALSEGLCLAQPTPQIVTQLPREHKAVIKKGLDLNETNARREEWFAESEVKFRQVFPNSNHYYYGKLHKINGDLLRNKGTDSHKVHDSYSKAAKIFDSQQCKLDAAYTHKADADVYRIEKNWNMSADCLQRAKKLVQDALPKTYSKSEHYKKMTKGA